MQDFLHNRRAPKDLPSTNAGDEKKLHSPVSISRARLFALFRKQKASVLAATLILLVIMLLYMSIWPVNRIESIETIKNRGLCTDSFWGFRLNKCPRIDVMQFEAAREKEVKDGVQRIYYINLDKNEKRKENMEQRLRHQKEEMGWDKAPIPYKRISALTGGVAEKKDKLTTCIPELRHPKRCNGLLGVLKTNLHIMRHYDVSGVSLIFEDDYVVKNLSLVNDALKYIPNDWDMIRFECGDHPRSTFPRVFHPNPKFTLFQANFVKPVNTTLEPEYFCGGAYAMLWRQSSISKLFNVWTRVPVWDLDCRLALDNNVTQYCFNTEGEQFGKHQPPTGEISDIPKEPCGQDCLNGKHPS